MRNSSLLRCMFFKITANYSFVFVCSGDSSVVKRRMVIERLLTPGSIPEQAMLRCVLEKTRYAYFPLGPSSQFVWWPSLTKDLQTEPKRKCSALYWL